MSNQTGSNLDNVSFSSGGFKMGPVDSVQENAPGASLYSLFTEASKLSSSWGIDYRDGNYHVGLCGLARGQSTEASGNDPEVALCQAVSKAQEIQAAG